MTGQWNVIAVMETVMTRPLARRVATIVPQDPSGTAVSRRRCHRADWCRRASRARDVARVLATMNAFAQSRHDRKKGAMLSAHLKRILGLGRLRSPGPSGAQFRVHARRNRPKPPAGSPTLWLDRHRHKRRTRVTLRRARRFQCVNPAAPSRDASRRRRLSAGGEQIFLQSVTLQYRT
jgi:hypothetical protein